MADCDHLFTLDRIEGSDGNAAVRTAWLRCTLCDQSQAVLTQRTDAEIQAELEAL